MMEPDDDGLGSDAEAPPPVVIDPNEVDKVSVTLEKNQQCRCKSCGKLFNSVWYLKQHAVKHSNDRPFKCKFCHKTYKFRSNLYQHKCPERARQLGEGGVRRRLLARGVAYIEVGRQESPSHDQDSPSSPEPPVFELVPVALPGASESETSPAPVPEPENVRPAAHGVRCRPLDPAFVAAYLARHRDQLFTCRRCRLQLPSRATLCRHETAHALDDAFCFVCPSCPQRFAAERRLRAHLELHGDPGSAHRCQGCGGAFRSALALRRHRDQSRTCYREPFGAEPALLVSPRAPLDPLAFVDSDEDDHACDEDSDKRSDDSGFRSRLDSSSSCSPPRSDASVSPKGTDGNGSAGNAASSSAPGPSEIRMATGGCVPVSGNPFAGGPVYSAPSYAGFHGGGGDLVVPAMVQVGICANSATFSTVPAAVFDVLLPSKNDHFFTELQLDDDDDEDHVECSSIANSGFAAEGHFPSNSPLPVHYFDAPIKFSNLFRLLAVFLDLLIRNAINASRNSVSSYRTADH